MIPPITPPTDNLYKFISLFGLTILLFSVYNLSVVFDQSATNKMKIEDVKVELQQAYYQKYEATHPLLEAEQLEKRFRPLVIKRLDQDLLNINTIIEQSEIDQLKQIGLKAKISKLNVAIDTLQLKEIGYITFIISGIALMAFGFFRWQHREQKLRDKMLRIEHALKVLERGNYNERSKNTFISLADIEALLKKKQTEAN